MPEPSRQIVFVLSTNYAGSHFLALQVASHSKCQSVGEFHRYGRPPHKVTRSACNICESDSVCPVFKGVYGASRTELFDRVFSNLEDYAPEVSTIVDNSKKWWWAENFLNLKEYDLRFLHLIRDPRALVRRWTMDSEARGEARKIRLRTARRLWRDSLGILFGPEDNVYTHKWLMQNREITQFLARHKCRSKLLTYQELAHFPDRALEDVMAWLGHPYEPSQREYWNFTHHGTQKAQYMKPQKEGGIHDQRWRTSLSHEAQVRTANHPKVLRYLAELDLSLTEDGLVLHPEWSTDAGDPVA